MLHVMHVSGRLLSHSGKIRLTGLAGEWLLAEEPAGQDRGVIDELCCGVALQHADGHEQRQAGECELHTEPHH